MGEGVLCTVLKPCLWIRTIFLQIITIIRGGEDIPAEVDRTTNTWFQLIATYLEGNVYLIPLSLRNFKVSVTFCSGGLSPLQKIDPIHVLEVCYHNTVITQRKYKPYGQRPYRTDGFRVLTWMMKVGTEYGVCLWRIRQTC